MCHLVESSIEKVLDENDNAAYLLALHRPSSSTHAAVVVGVGEDEMMPGFIRIK